MWIATFLAVGFSSPDTRFVSTTPTPSLPSSGITSLPRGKEHFVHRLFDNISPRYDLFNRISSLGLDQGWRRRAIANLKLAPGMQVLDLASGTGDLACLAAQVIAPLGTVIASDLSHPMLRLAGKKFERIPAAYWHIRAIQNRAEGLPFLSGTFHAATIGFALRNVSDLDATFREFHRVLKPGGALSLLEFSRPQGILLRFGHTLWLSTVVPLLGLLAVGSMGPFLYLRRSILQFMAPEQVVRQLQAAGFTEVHAEPLTGGIVFLYTARRL